ncbi:uncharacterized protein LOC130773514 [Actinidia eriantha]|uniref:uncharacterized protein LOC130773514 n=1 Tax=Actinidia eriantha TaxID=165200 RepID=UPI0025908E3B|nr:uncharacterized protein LOC130773514 [Actinidia eriantha]XP_057487426.1 uncharacterized protein LOC130773514 [Actinidia eriantha]
MAASDGIKQRKIVHQVQYSLTRYLGLEALSLGMSPLCAGCLAKDLEQCQAYDAIKVHITDAIQFVIGNYEVANRVIFGHGNEDSVYNVDPTSSNGTCNATDAEGKRTNSIDILLVDVDSSDLSSGITCPASDFVEESFLSTVKNSLSEQGLFVINLVPRSSAIREIVVSRMKNGLQHPFSPSA